MAHYLNRCRRKGRRFKTSGSVEAVSTLMTIPFSTSGPTVMTSTLPIECSDDGLTTLPAETFFIGGSATTSSLVAATGTSLPIASTGTLPAVDESTPFLDDSDGVYLLGGQVYQDSGNTQGDFDGTMDFHCEACCTVPDSVASIVMAKRDGTGAGWSLGFTASNEPQVIISDGTVHRTITGSAATPGTWIQMGVYFLDNSGTGIGFQVNGKAIGTAASTGYGSDIDNTESLTVGADSGLASKYTGIISYCGTWKGTAVFNGSHFNFMVGEQLRFEALVGIGPTVATGDTNTQLRTRGGDATLELWDSVAGQARMFEVSDNWPRVEKWISPLSVLSTGLYMEGAVTELLINNQTLASWTKFTAGDVVANNALIGPFDDSQSTSVNSIVADGTSATHGVHQSLGTIRNGYISNYQVIAKAGDNDWIQMRIPELTNLWANYNVSTGAKGLTGAGVLYQGIRPLGDGYYMCWFRFNGTGLTSHTAQIYSSSTNSATVAPTFTGDSSTVNTYLTLPGVAEARHQYAPVPTAGSTVTTATESLQYNGINGNIQGALGTTYTGSVGVYWQIRQGTETLSNRYSWTLKGWTTSYYHSIHMKGDAYTFNDEMKNPGTIFSSINVGSGWGGYGDGEQHRFWSRWSVGAYELLVDGTSNHTKSPASIVAAYQICPAGNVSGQPSHGGVLVSGMKTYIDDQEEIE